MGNLVTHIWKRFPTLPPAQDFWARMYIMAHGGPSIPFLGVLGGFFSGAPKSWAVEFLSSCKFLLQSSRCFLSTPIFFGLGGGKRMMLRHMRHIFEIVLASQKTDLVSLRA